MQNAISGIMELGVFKNAVPSVKRHVTVTMLLVTARMAVKVVGKEMIVWRVNIFFPQQ